jgi:hypothetical protein
LDELDPEGDAIAFGHPVGDLEAYAEIRSAPLRTYEHTVHEARTVLPTEYATVKLPIERLERDTAEGRQSDHAIHPANPDWPSSNAFRRQVSSIRDWISQADRKPVGSIAPYDTDGIRATRSKASKKAFNADKQ